MEKQRRVPGARLIREEVRAQMKRYAMAKSREEFINKFVEVMIPALGHHYRTVLAIINNHTDQVEKWLRQEEHFLEQFTDRLQEVTKAKGLDRRKAVAQALKELMEHDDARRRLESFRFQREYHLKKLIPLPENAHEDFLARVWEIVDTIFPRDQSS